MAIGKKTALAGLGALQEFGAFGGLTDGQLLERFGAGWGAGASTAFEVLVARHGPMVLRVCSSCLDDHHEVQDAFQANTVRHGN
ncbi:RNA polymerase sigma factor [Paludisphaera rhizosphaerae]|uniref:RNA polymerase sigma factor n=1 Tax=Paludisphaera rhizosphaerae TaxID=2711216 RepID=UPI0013EC7797|nr:sigma-70 family RNA polymerase sigma factor [Paludisphaera rhizosphaerae]